jgi:hypothetical protein
LWVKYWLLCCYRSNGWQFCDVAKRSDEMGKGLFPMKLWHSVLVACRCVGYEIRQEIPETTVLFEMYESFLSWVPVFQSVGHIQGFLREYVFLFIWNVQLTNCMYVCTGIGFPSQLSHVILHLLMDMVATSLPFNLRRPYI